MTKRTLCVFGLCLFGVTQGVTAQEAGSIKLGGVDLTPRLSTDVSFVDNVIYGNDTDNQVESWRSIIAPGLLMATEIGANKIQMNYHLSRGDFYSSQQDNFTDHFLDLTSDYELNSRHRLKGEYRFEAGHDDRGRRFSSGGGEGLDSPDTFKINRGIGVYSFGSRVSQAHIDFGFDVEDLDYDIDEGDYIFRDRMSKELSSQFYYRISTRTQMVFDLGRTNVDYDSDRSPTQSLDSTKTRFLGGLTWDSTATSTGYAKVGYERREFDSASRDDFSGLDWEIGFNWQPLTYSTVEFSTFSDTRETNGEGDYIDTQEYSVTWEHAWLTRLSTSIDVMYQDNEYIGDETAEEARHDKITNVRIGVSYDFRRWLNLKLYYNFDSRNSNRDLVAFDRNVIGVIAKVTL